MSTKESANLVKNPVISVVMPIYGVEAYLRDAVDSVIAQSISFEENIELILVNDGSPDNSEAICLEYAKKYPKNIVYVKQKNQGLSASRRNGFLKARGIYVHSMDSDDTISENFYEKSVEFFNNHKDEVDLVAAKLILFEARAGGHYGNYRFKDTRVIDINKEPTALQYHIASVVIKREAVDTGWFDEKLSIAEDARLLGLIVKRKMAYGVVSDITYNYRIRSSGGSLINTQHEKLDYYTETPKRFWKFVLDYWEKQDGVLAPYIQNYVLHDIQWRLNEQKKQNVLTKKDEEEYKKTVYETIDRLDDNIILSQRRLAPYKRIALLKRKYKQAFDKKISIKDNRYRINDNVLPPNVSDDIFFGLTFDFIHSLGDGKYRIEGFPINDTIHSRDQYVIETSRGDFKLTYVERVQRRNDGFLGDSFRNKVAFETTISIGGTDEIRAKIIRFDGTVIYVPIHTKRFTRLSELKSSYRQIDNLLLIKKKQRIKVYPYSHMRHALFEVRFIGRVLGNLNLRRAKNLLKWGIGDISARSYNPKSTRQLFKGLLRPFGFVLKNARRNIESVGVRLAYYIVQVSIKDKEPLWIITDRGIGAGDNGEAFFRYLQEQDDIPARSIFALSKKSSDYHRLSKIGPVIDMNSIKYRLLFLRSSKLISSQADEYIVNPYANKLHHVLDLYSHDFVFLQHGVTKNDISGWLNRFSKNIRIFVTVAKPEYDSILKYPFYYSSKEVLLSGFPRYDLLENTPKRKIMLAPTWRKYLTSGRIDKSGKWIYQPDFKNSDYYNFYNNLMNDHRIIEALKKHKTIGEFYLHPSHMAQIEDFNGNDQFVIKRFPYNYREAFSESNLLITDYSSVYFDFSYLRKPVIYTQFDRDFYYANHGVYEEGYFSESRDGFGPVVTSYEEAVDSIVYTIENNFKLDAKYKKRIDDFFKYDDRNNSERVAKAILEIDKKV